MWEIYEKKTLFKCLRKLPKHVLKHYELWKRIAELNGLDGIRQIKGFHDEQLIGNLKGFRSSRLNIKWRVVYKVDHHSESFYVFDVTPHNYD